MCPSGTTLASKSTGTSTFKSAFDVLDTDGDGKISREDLIQFYTTFHGSSVLDNDNIVSMMSIADFNEDGFVEYEEFERVLNGNYRKSTRGGCCGVMEDVFRVMDKDGDGKLSYGDLKSYMEWAGLDVSDEDIKAMIRLGGGSDGVSYNDLLKILAVDC